MFSFLRPWAFHFSQPPPLKDDPTAGPSPTLCPPTLCPPPTGSDHHHYLSDPALYQGPIDVTPADMPNLFDILLSDIDEKVLHDEISTALGSVYLSETPHLTSPHATVDGIIFGRHNRVLFPLVVRIPHKSLSHVIHFLYDSGSPFTYLSQEACDKLFGSNPVPTGFRTQINGKEIQVYPPNAGSHFEHVNLLGADFCAAFGIEIIINYDKKTATMHFPSWEQASSSFIGSYLDHYGKANAWPEKRFIYTETIAGLSILLSLIWLFPFAGGFLHWPMDIVISAVWFAAFGLLINALGRNGCAFSWSGITQSGVCNRWRAREAFNFIAAVCWLLSAIVGIWFVSRTKTDRAAATSNAGRNRRRWFRQSKV